MISKANTLSALRLIIFFVSPSSQNKNCRFYEVLGFECTWFSSEEWEIQRSMQGKKKLKWSSKNQITAQSISHSQKQNKKNLAFETAAWNLSQASMRLTDSKRHAKGKGRSHEAALLIGLPLCTCSVWPRKIERHSIANRGRGQNKMIIKNTTALKQKYCIITFSNPESTL